MQLLSGHEVMLTTKNNMSSNVFNMQVPPGSSCSNNEICGGGSFCSLPVKLCLCPGDMEDFNGQCLSSERHAILAVGANCNDAVRCLNGTTCVGGHCRCPIPLTQEGDRCVEKQSVLRVGPGELCNGSQICSRGSVCHPIIPVCICPENTVLQENSCFPIPSGVINQIANIWTLSKVISTTTEKMQKFLTTPKLNIKFGRVGQAAVGFPCRDNVDCIIGAFCKVNTNPATCQCLSTHVNIDNFCEKVIYPGQSGCHHDIQCSMAYAASECSAGHCICPDSFNAVEQTCKPGFGYD
uniref:EB domain-containing protein n=1 Tax=Loa loa TaxID=7209 RepID=A0A1I7W1W1_LOALO